MPSSPSPLRCTSPADVYILLKSSDFIVHDLSAESVFEGCTSSTSTSTNVNVNVGGDENSNDDNDDDLVDDDDRDQDRDRDRDQVSSSSSSYKLELVLRKWFAIDPSREMRAFVREGVLVGAFVFRFVFVFVSCK